MLSVFVAIITVYLFALRVHALNDRHCDARGVSPTPVPGVLLTDEQHANFTRNFAAMAFSDPYPASDFTQAQTMGILVGEENGEGSLLTRQVRTLLCLR
jgi:hypothetical protein